LYSIPSPKPSGQFQDLSCFRLPTGSRGRPAWFVQLWWLFDALFVRSTPQALYSWRRFVWRLFGAKVGRNVLIRPGVRVTFPWKVVIDDYCWIGDNATLYSVGTITIGEHSVISQEAYLCAGTHDHCDILFPLVASPITVEPECWIAARAFVGPGVRVGRGAVVGACSVILSDVPPAMVVAGVPAQTVGIRKVRNIQSDVAPVSVPHERRE
jgi:putative colanic acid biosynthesis acetyltransferase WcaF